jgi:chromosome segregation protein
LEQKRFLHELEKKRSELEDLITIQMNRLEEVKSEINRHLVSKDRRSKEVEQAAKIADDVKNLILEFEAKKSLLDLLAPEERAILEIENLQAKGVMKNVLGRLRDLIQFDQKYEKAINTAGEEWLDSLVVKDMATAIACMEYLKRFKLGKLKIIPIEEIIPPSTQPATPIMRGVLGKVKDHIKFDETLEQVVRYVFGDTMITDSPKTAYLTSIKGYRAVTMTGDLCEPSGFLRSGYRDPDLLRSIFLHSRILNEIREAAESLIALIEKNRHILIDLDTQLEKLKNEQVDLLRSIGVLQRDIDNINLNITSATNDMAEMKKRLASMGDALQKSVDTLLERNRRKSELEQRLIDLESERKALRSTAGFEDIMDMEENRRKILDEINGLRREAAIIDSKISALKSNIDSKIKLGEHAKEQLSYLLERSREVRSSIDTLQSELEDWTLKLSNIKIEREDLITTLDSIRREMSENQIKLGDLNSSIQKVEREIEAVNSDLTTLKLELNRRELEQQYLTDELGRLGFQRPTTPTPIDFKTLEENLSILRRELEEIGAVNELAVTHYEEQKNNYKQLSVRINQLEQERTSILRFMDELEQKKRETFIEVFERLNRNFNDFFSKITDGGRGNLVLENPNDIFSGGVDINLAFPGKAEMSVGSASGGEKSVATVCFLLALQAIHPMPFYVFDEIDAHLDMVNSQRLADLLKERSSNSQFIVVSLKDSTISRADDVYGVYVQEGSSRVVAMPKPEVKLNVRV